MLLSHVDVFFSFFLSPYHQFKKLIPGSGLSVYMKKYRVIKPGPGGLRAEARGGWAPHLWLPCC